VEHVVKGIDVYSWNPRRALVGGRFAQWTSLGPRQNNFGDLLGPVIVRLLLDRLRPSAVGASPPGRRLISVGSVLHFAHSGDVVWGSGVNGKMLAYHRFDQLDVRAVRGPRTARFLTDRGLEVPEVYGDPALLVVDLMPDLVAAAEHKTAGVVVVPNLNDINRYSEGQDPRVVNPRGDLSYILRRIAEAELVVGSSLHAMIVAESLGIPARLVTPGAESALKYLDYYEGTGRDGCTPADTVEAAVKMGGEPPISWSPQPLIASFPTDLWRD
jgi:pyruvyltransferase